jgi:hypothetical protein
LNNGGMLRVTNTILAGSRGGDCDSFTPFTDAGGNLADDGSCAFTQASSKNFATSLNLGTLANNGGPTQTIALLPGSVAIDSTTCLQSTDQRGFPRPDVPGTTCDSGAYEFQDVLAQIHYPITLITSFNLSSGLTSSLDTQLQAVLADLQANNTTQACNDLAAFANHVLAQSGKMLTTAQADQLLAAASTVRAVLAC